MHYKLDYILGIIYQVDIGYRENLIDMQSYYF